MLHLHTPPGVSVPSILHRTVLPDRLAPYRGPVDLPGMLRPTMYLLGRLRPTVCLSLTCWTMAVYENFKCEQDRSAIQGEAWPGE